MNTGRKGTLGVIGRNCEHTFLIIGGETIRSARPVKRLARNPVTGDFIRKPCPFPRCGRTTVVQPTDG
jgi:hypothetical protein